MRAIVLSRRAARAPAEKTDRDRFARLIAAIGRGGIEGVHVPVSNAHELEAAIEGMKPDIVFSAAHRVAATGGGEASVHGALERWGLPFVGSSAAAIDLALSKPDLKDRWIDRGIATPPYFFARREAGGGVYGLDRAMSASDFPYIVKPASEGNSRGIGEDSVVHDGAALRRKILEVIEGFGSAIAECYLGRYADAREFTVAMIGSPGRSMIMPAEIRVAKGGGALRVITNDDKVLHRIRAEPVGDPDLRSNLASFAARAFTAAGVRDYARFDLMMADGRLWAIEINGQPMVPDRWFASCAKGAGLGEAEYLNAIFLAAAMRTEESSPGVFRVPEALRAAVSPAVREILRGATGA